MTAGYFAPIADEFERRQKFKDLSLRFARELDRPDAQIDVMADQFARDLQGIIPDIHGLDDYIVSPAAQAELGQQLRRQYKEDPRKLTFFTGFRQFDYYVRGWRKSEMYGWLADTGIGKSTLLLQVMWVMARQTPCIYFTPEMDRNVLTVRLFSGLSGIDLKKVEDATLSEEGEVAWDSYGDMVNAGNLWLVDIPELDIDRMEYYVRRIQTLAQEPVGAICLDHLQELSGEDDYKTTTKQTDDLHKLTRRYKLVCHTISQISLQSLRDGLKGEGRGSRKLKFVVAGMFHINKDDLLPDRRLIDGSKNRHGRCPDFQAVLDCDSASRWYTEPAMLTKAMQS